MQCWNTEGIFRLIQSIPSSKAEPFKRWLARIGKERIDEIENPELAMGRMQELYEKKGYPKEWIDKRLRGIAVRQDLTDEWKDRGASTSVEFALQDQRRILADANGRIVDERDHGIGGLPGGGVAEGLDETGAHDFIAIVEQRRDDRRCRSSKALPEDHRCRAAQRRRLGFVTYYQGERGQTGRRRLLIDGISESDAPLVAQARAGPPGIERHRQRARGLVAMTDAAGIWHSVGDGIADVRNVDGVIGECVEHAAENLRHVAIETGRVPVMRVRCTQGGNRGVAGGHEVSRGPGFNSLSSCVSACGEV